MNVVPINVRSLIDSTADYTLGQQMVVEYTRATALEMAAPIETVIPYIDDYYQFPGKCFPGGDFLMALCEKSAAGCLRITPAESGLCEMNRLWVRPDFRKMGVAKQLILHSLSRAKELGYSWMGLDVLPTRVGAIRLYENLGFETCELFHDYEFEMVALRRKL